MILYIAVEKCSVYYCILMLPILKILKFNIYFSINLTLNKLYSTCSEDIVYKPHSKEAGNKETEGTKKRHTPNGRFHICLNNQRGSDNHSRDNQTKR